MSDDKNFAVAKEMKPGKYLLIDNEPCRVVSVDISKPGKHGAAKMQIVAMTMFGNKKKNLLTPSDGEIEVPIVRRRTLQVVSINGTSAQGMDKETFEMVDFEISEEYQGQVEEGKDVEILEAMGKRAIERVFKS